MRDVIFDFKGKNFVVVGASSGIGRKIMEELADSGANVLAIARNNDRLREAAGGKSSISTVSLDVTQASEDEWQAIIREYVEKNGKINGGIYAAGITGITPLKAYDKILANQIMQTSFYGSVEFMHNVSKKKFSEAGASFVLLSSVAALEGPRGLIFYSGSKAAVQVGTKTMAKELANRKIRVNCISPAWVDTEMTRNYLQSVGQSESDANTGLFGIGKPDDVSGMALFLLSSRASWITGQNIYVDGGYL